MSESKFTAQDANTILSLKSICYTAGLNIHTRALIERIRKQHPEIVKYLEDRGTIPKP